jgi:integrase
VEPGSKSRVRFEVMLLTGMSAIQVGRLRPEHIDWTAPVYLAPRRQKGRVGHHRQRGRQRVIRPRPLLPDAIPALQRLFALGANTKFGSSSITRSVKRAIAAANRRRAKKSLPLIPTTLQIKDLTRHTFGTEVFRATRNVAHVQHLLGHSDPEMSQRYALAAIREDLTVGMAELSKRARLGSAPRRRRRRTLGKVSPPIVARAVRTRRTEKSKNAE